jgi:hypothetical protein
MLNSREAALSSLYRADAPEFTPIGFFAIDSDTASKVLGRATYWRAKAECQIAFWEGRRDEVVESWKNDAIELYEKLDIIDIIPISHMAGLCPPKDYEPDPPRKVASDTWEDARGRVFKYSPATRDISMVSDPGVWQREFNVEDYESLKPQKPDDSIFEVVDALIKHFKGKRLLLGSCGQVEGWFLAGGMERGFMDIASRPGDIAAIYKALCEKAIDEDQYYIRPGQDGVLLGTDFASSQGPMINPQTYRDIFYDSYKKRIANLKANGQVVVQHACGNNEKFMDILTTIGADCYQSIQPSAGMDIIELHKQYGDVISLWGGVAVETLISKTPGDVAAEVDRFMRYANGKTGLIMGTSHSIAVGTKYENFMALMDACSRYR